MHIFLACLAITSGFAASALGCGDDDGAVPDDAIARVGNAEISRAELDRRLAAADRLRELAGDSVSLPARDELHRQLAQQLIKAEWLRQEAAARGVRLKRWGVRAWLRSQADGGSLSADALAASRAMNGGAEQAYTALRLERLIERTAKPVAEADVREYYEQHKDEYGSPEIRSVKIVRTPSRAAIERAKAALDGGATWEEVVRRYSVDDFPRGHRTQVVATTPGEWETPLDKAVYAARRGVTTGPIRTRSGWYLFKLAVIRDGVAPTFASAKSTIRQELEARRAQAAAPALQRRLTTDYRATTTCSADLGDLPECGGRNG